MSQTPIAASGIGEEILTAAPASAPRSADSHRHLVVPALLDTFRSLFSIIIIALFALTFIVQPFRIPSESMERTLLVGDFLLVNKMVFSPSHPWSALLPYKQVKRGDIVVFLHPPDPDKHLVKRVIGVPGDRIRIQDAHVYINGRLLDEPYAVFETAFPNSFRDNFPGSLYGDPGIDPHWWLEMRHSVRNGELIVPPDQYFVMGDNRNHSSDSRYWGFVPRQNMEGRPFVIYFSLRKPSTTDLPSAISGNAAHAVAPDVPVDPFSHPHAAPTSSDQPASSANVGDRLGHDGDAASRTLDFARWNRMFRIVR